MSEKSLASEILDWASSNDGKFDADRLDRLSPFTVAAFKNSLSRPLVINVVERIESLAKLMWADVLEPFRSLDPVESVACGDFFSELGFLFKYKPYGVKIASPFGYSIFDLNDGQGFSFQLHVEPKLEGFHILRTKSRSLVYISSRDEWVSEGEAWARSSLSSGQTIKEPPFVLRPNNGDVIEVSTTEVVHSVLGCVLEEYASCSVDAVERLFDQNTRSKVELPLEHPNVAEILAQCRSGLPLRRMDRTSRGWLAADWLEGTAAIEVEGDLWGSRIKLSGEDANILPASTELLRLVIAVDAPVELRLSGRSRIVPRGSFACVSPGLDASISSLAGECSVALHCVSRKLVQSDWTRLSPTVIDRNAPPIATRHSSRVLPTLGSVLMQV